MSECFIGFGCNKYYLFIFGNVIFKLLSFLMIYTMKPYKPKGLFGFTPVLSKYIFIQSLYKYISFIIGGLLFTYLIKINLKEEKNPKNIQNLKLKGIIHNIKSDGSEKQSITQILLISFIFFIHTESKNIFYIFYFNVLEFWVVDFIFIIIFINIYYVINIYKHQKCAMIFILANCCFFFTNV